jgi:hypothetical protein|tara:strand:+ start:10222 stop:10326 length:105 start_codon:yes stop_codon:yes gene_type:complete
MESAVLGVMAVFGCLILAAYLKHGNHKALSPEKK